MGLEYIPLSFGHNLISNSASGFCHFLQLFQNWKQKEIICSHKYKNNDDNNSTKYDDNNNNNNNNNYNNNNNKNNNNDNNDNDNDNDDDDNVIEC